MQRRSNEQSIKGGGGGGTVTKILARGKNRSGQTNFGDQKLSAGPLFGRATFAATVHRPSGGGRVKTLIGLYGA